MIKDDILKQEAIENSPRALKQYIGKSVDVYAKVGKVFGERVLLLDVVSKDNELLADHCWSKDKKLAQKAENAINCLIYFRASVGVYERNQTKSYFEETKLGQYDVGLKFAKLLEKPKPIKSQTAYEFFRLINKIYGVPPDTDFIKITGSYKFEPHGKASETWEEIWTLELPLIPAHWKNTNKEWIKCNTDSSQTFTGRTHDEVFKKAVSFLLEFKSSLTNSESSVII